MEADALRMRGERPLIYANLKSGEGVHRIASLVILERTATGLLPVIAEIKSALAALTGCRAAAMSSSGLTCFGIFATRWQARQGAAVLAARYPEYWIVQVELA